MCVVYTTQYTKARARARRRPARSSRASSPWGSGSKSSACRSACKVSSPSTSLCTSTLEFDGGAEGQGLPHSVSQEAAGAGRPAKSEKEAAALEGDTCALRLPPRLESSRRLV